MTSLIAVVIIAVLTALAMIATRHKILKAPLTILVLGCVAIGWVVSVSAYNRLQAQRAYDTCSTSVTRSDGNRTQWHDLADRLEARGLPDDAEFLRTQLNLNLPDRSLAECPKEP